MIKFVAIWKIHLNHLCQTVGCLCNVNTQRPNPRWTVTSQYQLIRWTVASQYQQIRWRQQSAGFAEWASWYEVGL